MTSQTVISKPKILILWLGCDEYEEFAGKLEDAISYVKQERRYQNYGHNGAMIVWANPVYSIENKPIETHYEMVSENESDAQFVPKTKLTGGHFKPPYGVANAEI